MAYRPGWVDHLIGWHVYPLGFVGAPARLESQEVSHRLAHLGAGLTMPWHWAVQVWP